MKLLSQIQSPADLRRLPREQLRPLADELRAYLLDSVSKTGGHLSSNLGTVELTVALHYVFNTPHDRLVWDVGHQTYPHKILTGRRDRMRPTPTTCRSSRSRSAPPISPLGSRRCSTAGPSPPPDGGLATNRLPAHSLSVGLAGPRVTKRRWTMSNHGIFPRRRRDNDLDQDGPPDESRQG